jgi:hypothetical protein
MANDKKRKSMINKMERTFSEEKRRKEQGQEKTERSEVGILIDTSLNNSTTMGVVNLTTPVVNLTTHNDNESAQILSTAAQKIGTQTEEVVKPKRIMPKSPGRPRKSELQKKADREARIKAAAEAKKAGDPIVFGFCEIPAEWPTLPANSSLASDIQWVQSNRLRVCEETPEGTRVNLSQSINPAPSWSAIGWLETSIRSYAKYCEITARATQSVEDGNAAVRRERATLDQLRSILADMTA